MAWIGQDYLRHYIPEIDFFRYCPEEGPFSIAVGHNAAYGKTAYDSDRFRLQLSYLDMADRLSQQENLERIKQALKLLWSHGIPTCTPGMGEELPHGGGEEGPVPTARLVLRGQQQTAYARHRGAVGRAEELPVQLPLFARDKSSGRELDVLAPEPRRKPWAWLLRHVFAIDVSTRPRCGGATRWLEAATKPDAIARLLAKHGLGPRPPPRRSAPGEERGGSDDPNHAWRTCPV